MLARQGKVTARSIVTLGVVVVVCVIAGAGALAWLRPMVTVTEAVEGPVVEAFYSTGTVQPDREFPIKSNLAGVVTEVRVDKGARVSKGDVLAVVSDPEVVFRQKKASAELREKLQRAEPTGSPVLAEFDAKILASGEMLELARREQQRVTRMLETNSATQTDLDAAMDRLKRNWSEYESLKAQRSAKQIEMEKDVEVARAALESAEWNIEQQTLRSPINGVVLDRPTSLGTRVAVNDHLMQIADVTPTNLVMRAAVDEEDKNKVRLGQLVRMTLYSFPGEIFNGQVDRVYDKADPDRRTFEVDVKVTEGTGRENLAAGMTGELAFVIAEKSRAVVVPSQAVQSERVVVERDGVLSVVENLQLGLRSVERVEIIAGLKTGERVVISPVGEDAPGQRVRTRFIDPAVAAHVNKVAEKDGSFKGF